MKKGIYLAVLAVLSLAWSCTQSIENIAAPNERSSVNNEGPHVCIEKPILGDIPEGAAGGVINKGYKWTTGTTIRIKFLNGSTFLQDKVKQFASEWMSYANLKFQFVSAAENADIKIGFKFGGNEGSWSYYGTDCRTISQNMPSMNFGWFDEGTSDDEFSRMVIHEFGHALGLIHEHLSPNADIPWNKPVVYEYYARQGWSKEMVDNNLFNKFDATLTNFTAFDSQSIMLYAIPAEHTTNGFSVSWNRVLSATDKNFIAQEYPFPIKLNIKALLSGALSGTIMTKSLNDQNFIPIFEPYKNIWVTPKADIARNNITDWVLVELHSATNSATVVESKAALLKNDGTLLNPGGLSTLSLCSPAGNYYVVIKHRNHLGVMTSQAVALSGTAKTIDFTASSTATYGSNAQRSINGVMAMWGCNANNDNKIIYIGTNTDTDAIKTKVVNWPANTRHSLDYVGLLGYHTEDLNLDGRVVHSSSRIVSDVTYIVGAVMSHPENPKLSRYYIINEQLP